MLHKFHRLSACVLGAYVALHIFNHLLALDGVEAHMHFMEAFRHVYRVAAVESVLLTCAAFQIVSGLRLVYLRRGQRHNIFERLQALSGMYLAGFLLIHVGAVLIGRVQLHLDTNFYFAAAGMHVTPFQVFFVPYYFLAVSAIFVHLACAFRWLSRERIGVHLRNGVAFAMIGSGLLAAALIVATFSGAFYTVTIPEAYRATYRH